MLSRQQTEKIHRIWSGLAQFKAGEPELALEFLLEALIRVTGADGGLWVGSVRLLHGAAARRDLQHGWRGRAVKLLRPSAARLALSARLIRNQETPTTALTTIAVAAAAGRFRAVRLRQLVDLAAFRRTIHYRDFYHPLGLGDRMWISYPVNADVESHFVLDRAGPRRRFSLRELEMAREVLRGLGWFHRQTLLSYGLLIASSPLSPTQRGVLAQLLTGASEKEIAAALGQSFHTTHTHVRAIFRRYGVTSRQALMAFWLDGA